MSEPKALIRPDRGQDAIAIHLVNKDGFEAFAKGLNAGQRASLAAQKFDGSGYQYAIIPDGDTWFVVSGVANPESLSSWCLAKLAEELPEGVYRVANAEPGPAMFGWITGQYRFTRYKSEDKAQGPRVLLTAQAGQIDGYVAEAQAEILVRDLVNAPIFQDNKTEQRCVTGALPKAHAIGFARTNRYRTQRDQPFGVGVQPEHRHFRVQ